MPGEPTLPAPDTIAPAQRVGRKSLKNSLLSHSMLVRLGTAALASGGMFGAISGEAASQESVLGYEVGDTILHPQTQESLTITQVLQDRAVLTENNIVIYPTLSEIFHTPRSVILNPIDGDTSWLHVTYRRFSRFGPAAAPVERIIAVEGCDYSDSSGGICIPSRVESLVSFEDLGPEAARLFAALTTGGDTGGSFGFGTGTNNVADVRRGGNGADGRDGGGINLGLFIIGQSALPGTAGAAGPNFSRTVPDTHSDIRTTAARLPGVVIGSVGGSGGSGGDSYLSLGVPAAAGGAAARGGNVTGTNHADITTSGVEAHGVFVYSRSGDGGQAGDVIAGIAQGGTGGAGNGGGTATGNNYGAITTTGRGANGLLVQSLGGASGDGGGSFGIVGIPGNSLQAGTGGTAIANNFGSITTSGEGAHGVVAQSIGGTGGQAGGSVGIVALGNASGGTGGSSGAATAVNGGSIVTSGTNAYGLFAQSVGGGGGDGAFAAGLVSLGSAGGGGGNGGTATARQDGNASISTRGNGSFGIYATSIGGGGGNGGVGGAALAGIGGSGTVGGTASAVQVTTADGTVITTIGTSAHGIFAASVGGGGGVGATGGAGIVGIGGSGSGGGNAGTVTVTSAGSIDARGFLARGIFAQSVGGGGGASNGTGGQVAIGGSGGSGGQGMAVSVSNSGDILTGQFGGDGIFAQSVGGGGGSGSAAGGLVSLGGSGGAGGNASGVTVTNSGQITTSGLGLARGIFAQSIGLGGGAGGAAGGLVTMGGTGGTGGTASRIGTGGAVTVGNSGDIGTLGTMSSAIQAQSVGGGGGDGGTTGGVFLTIGGGGNTGGDAGDVVINNSGNLSTTGHDSHGIFGQALGGGGGNGGSTVSISAFAGAAIGGTAGAGGDGGNVTVVLSDNPANGAVPVILTEGVGSRGIFAQSVGGGGGNGGFSVQATGGYGAAASFSLGGDGGDGGIGGSVSLSGDVSVQTGGVRSEGILLQSLGGGGGNGGLSVSFAGAAASAGAGAFALGIGGDGGKGGDGGAVTAASGGQILTLADFATGFLAQSVGGGGGNGAFSVTLAAAGSGGAAGSVAVGLGGSGGDGGNGNIVNATFNGNIETRGNQAGGALIQSTGGGGGNGAFNITGAVSLGGTAGVSDAFGIGGSGGGGGTGGNVNGHIGGDVSTWGAMSTGVIVQSLGGGGGAGGFNISGSVGGGGEVGFARAIGVGGSGGDGGAAGTVDASARSIVTSGDNSGGFLAQSVGGGGGAGAFNISGNIAAATSGASGLSVGLSVGVGGAGGGGGDASRVEAILAGDVLTRGANSDGVVAQSTGGGGGSGALNVAGSISASPGIAGAISIGVGGAGGGGGNGGDVALEITGGVRTEGNGSEGIIAQSVGGGGGNGGLAIAGNLVASQSAGAGSVAVSIGGVGGGGGNAGSASLTVNSGITDPDNTLLAAATTGADAQAITVQSIGGGGGNGGISVNGGVTLSSQFAGNIGIGIGGSGGDGGSASSAYGLISGDVATAGHRSGAVMVQSVGGGGGSGSFNISGGIAASKGVSGNLLLGVGGFGGDGGASGTVSGGVAGDISTNGFRSFGVTYQSIGGGGGSGAFNITGGVSLAVSESGAGTLGIGVGGFGGDGGSTSSVDAFVNGNVWTAGIESHGVLMQSLAGGGGSGGFNIAGAVALSGGTSGAIGFGLGGFGGAGGTASTVTGSLAGNVTTFGYSSDGVVLQSLGGGGGNGALNVTGALSVNTQPGGSVSVGVGIGGFGGDGGNAGAVTGTSTGLYQTQGRNSAGIIAQSLAGGGGNGAINIGGAIALGSDVAATAAVGVGGFGGNGGDSAAVHLIRSGDTHTAGEASEGVLAQSVGGGGGRGGFNISGGIAGSTTSSGNIVFGLGGFGGGGGNAGSVTGGVTGNITTAGRDSDAFTFQSNGGGGGRGGFNVAGDISFSAQSGGAGGFGVGIGGFGGDGGAASFVDAHLTGDVMTRGDESHGILLQSLGGSGGSAGLNVSGSLSLTGGTSGSLAFGMGGFGGSGGSASTVTGILQGDVVTLGDASFGALLQSLGGGGGSGSLNVTGLVSLATTDTSSAGISLGLGGFGGGGGSASTVSGRVTGDYQTGGVDADGVVAQSVGGGGGMGGLNISGGVAVGGGATGTAAIGVGGFGGAGGNAGAVSLTRIGDTVTQGALSDGVVAQSLAGGGGNGGLNVSGGVSISTGGSAGSLGFGLGGFGGDGGTAGNVVANITGNVIASGVGSVTQGTILYGDTELATRLMASGSHGVIAQSAGGGGGIGGLNITGGVSIARPGTTGATSRVTSIGIGGFGGAGGDAGTVDLILVAPALAGAQPGAIGQVSAVGDERSAVVAQSLGGSGGIGGINISGGLSLGGQLVTGIGGFGGGGGLASRVNADVTANLFASGFFSRGFLAQSVGGGGGYGGINIAGGIRGNTAGEDPSLVFGLGGEGGAGNRSGDVVARQVGQVQVEGVHTAGVVAQSIAGGGGTGALNVTTNFSAVNSGPNTNTSGYAVAIGIGGDGGAGADAGSVQLRSEGNIIVNGQFRTGALPGEDTLEATAYTGFSNGVLAQSVGGGGGMAGVNITSALAPFSNPMAIGLGGSGGSGGNAGSVTIFRGDVTAAASSQLVRTFGGYSTAMVAQSVGGGGGQAGVNISTALSNVNGNTEDTVAALIAVGGDGGGSGSGAAVTVNHNGNLVTDGDASGGLLAQSVGGGGGNANFNIGAGAFYQATAFNMSVGGAPTAGGRASTVTVHNVGNIVTTGHDANGITAQSVGGGGGNTMLSMAAGVAARHSLNLNIGRRGGAGGISGDVAVTANGIIDTRGDRSSGIVAQSLAGGGGISSTTSVGATVATGSTQAAGGDNSDYYSANIAVGIEGGTGAAAGNVEVESTGTITTRGSQSHGIHGQSVGGGGGIGGSAFNMVFRQSLSATVGVGGAGGSGATARSVRVNSASEITTLGDRSVGILAHSLGGGGGSGGFSATIGTNLAPQANISSTNPANAIAVNVGGDGGTGALGGRVDVINRGDIWTRGAWSHGIHAQSVGGGGGDGGMIVNLRSDAIGGSTRTIDLNIGGAGSTGGRGGSVEVANSSLVYTTGRDAVGINANSIGGGGGSGGLLFDLVLASPRGQNPNKRAFLNLGGDGGTGGAGGDVRVSNTGVDGVIVTTGDGGYGILAQSLGGGGGNGTSIISLAGISASEENATLGLNIGGSGDSGGYGGNVTVINSGVIDTAGSNAHGVLAQSIGGGGGNGGLSLTVNSAISAAPSAPVVSLGGNGGSGGNGGTVTVDNSGSIVTRGANSHGVFAQSIGDGGGNAGLGVTLTADASALLVSNALSYVIGGEGGAGGIGGDVIVNHTGDITVLGDGSQAIRAESINGGGGTVELSFEAVFTNLTRPPLLDSLDQSPPDRNAIDTLQRARLGSRNSDSMNAGRVTENRTGTIHSAGDHAPASLVQSVGGGGGQARLIATLAPTPVSQLARQNALTGAAATTHANPATTAIDMSFVLGAIDGTRNNGGDLRAETQGDTLTTGQSSHAAMMQSIGGGGGRLVVDISGDEHAQLAPIDIAFGSTNGSIEQGGDIQRSQSGTIVTTGDRATGALIQSVGGGGGSADINLDIGDQSRLRVRSVLGSDGGNVLDAGDVTGSFAGGLATFGDQAVGLTIQSIGAGGGDVRIAGSERVGVTLGGLNGASGNGGNMTAGNAGAIQTGGLRSHGVLMQSVGGGGGIVTTDARDVSLGLNAENVGNGGNIRFEQSGDIVTQGAEAIGAVLQSLGGGGGWVDGVFAGSSGGTGNGGDLVSIVDGVIFTSGEAATGFMAQTIGGADGNGGAIDLSRAGGTGTSGASAHGVLLQSIGGGGGIVFDASSADLILSPMGRGDGGVIGFTQSGNILTEGDTALGVILQSLGGGGGWVSNSFAGSTGATGNGADINAVVDGVIATGGTNSTAVLAQSIAGQVGDGGFVSLVSTGAIQTTGNGAHGVLLQSIGGGGGTVFDAASASLILSATGNGDGGAIDFTQSGNIVTEGDAALGVILQSLGGGGGWVSDSFAGSSGAAGNGADINAVVDGVIATAGANSIAVLAQSIGGQTGIGGAVSLVSTGGIQTSGNGSHGVLLQSIGGGGGTVFDTSSMTTALLSLPGQGDGGDISLAQSGNIYTEGDNTIGAILQSLGGGGGWQDGVSAGSAGGVGRGGAIDFSIDGSVWAVGLDSTGVFAQSAGGDGGDNIHGLLTGMVRGGSGTGRGLWIDGGANNLFTTAVSLSAVSTWAIEASFGDDAVINTGIVVGNIDLGSGVNSFDNRAGSTFVAIHTIDLRDGSPQTGTGPIRLRSGATSGPADSTRANAQPGPAANLPAPTENAPTTQAPTPTEPSPLTDQAARPVATDVSDAPAPALIGFDLVSNGGGRERAPAGVDQTIVSSGPDAKRPVQSELSTEPHTPTIALTPARVASDSKRPVQDEIPALSGKPAGVQVMAVLDANDTPALSAVEQATLAAAADPVNAATFRNSGNFLMGLSASTYPIDLLNGATFGDLDGQGDPTINLYYGTRVTNTVELDGHFEQTADGHLVFDVAFGPYASDRVNVTGSATVDGTGDITLTWLESDAPVTLFATGAGGVDNGLNIRDTMAVDYSIAADSAGVHLLIETDFGLPSLNRNGRSLGGHMDSAIRAGGSAGIGRLLTLLGNMQSDQLDVYEAIFAELNPEPHLAVMHGQLASANRFAEDLFNCGSAVSAQGDECVWSRLEMTESSRDATVEALGVEAQSMRFTGGFEQRVGDDWSVAVGVSYEDGAPTRIDGHRARTESQGFSVGIGVERNAATGPYYGASISGGWSWHETERAVTVFESGIGTSSPETGYARLDAHVGESFRHGSLFARPQISTSLTAVHHDGLVEDGLDGLGIEVRADAELVGAINPQMTVGHVFRETDDMVGVISVTGGLRLSTQNRLELPMRFLGSNPVADPAVIGTSLDQLVYQAGVDIEIAGDDRVGLSMGYSAEFGQETEHHRAGIDFRLRF